MRKIVAVVGDAMIEYGSRKYELAYNTGKLLVDNGYRVQSGGHRGVMEAAFEGAHASPNYVDGDTIALLPSFDAHQTNPYADIIIPTGLDVFRNAIVANASAVVAVGGGAGTLSEMAFAWSLKRLVIGYTGIEGWSAKLAGTRIDSKHRYDYDDDMVFPAKTPEEMIVILNNCIDKYDTYHSGIRYGI